MKRGASQRAVVGAVAFGLVVLALVGYFVLIAPQRSKVASLRKEIEETQQKIEVNRVLSRRVSKPQPIRVADLFRLSKAMPDRIDMPGVLLELNRIATETGISFESISPHGAVSQSSYQVVPIDLVFQGNFYSLSDFLYRLRNLVRVRDGQLDATGRLFAVDKLDFSESDAGFPRIRATLTVDAFVYGAPAAAPSPPPAAATTGTTSTTEAPDVPPLPGVPATAAGATP